MAGKRQQAARKSGRPSSELLPAVELDVVATWRLWDRLLSAFTEHLRNTYRGRTQARGFHPFPVVSAIDDASVERFAKLWDLPAVRARRRLAEEFVDALHLDRGDLVVWL